MYSRFRSACRIVIELRSELPSPSLPLTPSHPPHLLPPLPLSRIHDHSCCILHRISQRHRNFIGNQRFSKFYSTKVLRIIGIKIHHYKEHLQRFIELRSLAQSAIAARSLCPEISDTNEEITEVIRQEVSLNRFYVLRNILMYCSFYLSYHGSNPTNM